MVVSTPVTYPKDVVINYYENFQSPLIIGLDGLSLSENSKKTISTVKPSGIILMGNNINEYRQTALLIKDIKKYGKKLGIRIKIFVDEEGGLVSRFSNLEGYPQNSGIFKFDSDKTQKQSEFMKKIGIDVNLAPVADIAYSESSTIYLRSGGSNPETVSRKIQDFMGQMSKNSIETTLKHFPGHGRTVSDSHETLPVINIKYQDWIQSDAIPFKRGIEEGTKYVMLGHLIYPQIDHYPSTYSSKWVDILRKNLNFKQKIITDDLKMGGANIIFKDVLCRNTYNKESYEYRIISTLHAGINHPLIILTEKETIETYKKWVEMYRNCLP